MYMYWKEIKDNHDDGNRDNKNNELFIISGAVEEQSRLNTHYASLKLAASSRNAN